MRAIGEVSKLTGIKIPTIRFYEQEGLLPSPPRTQSGRRLYSDAHVRRLAFIRHARVLGFEFGDIRLLLRLADRPDRSCSDADRIARTHLGAIHARINKLRKLERELKRMITACDGGAVAECSIIEALADQRPCAHQY